MFYFVVLQVETVGDKYMAVSGLPVSCQDHARCIARLALDMMELSKEVIVDEVPIVSFYSILYNFVSIRYLYLPTHQKTGKHVF